MTELAGETPLTMPRSSGRLSASGRDREDKPEYKVKISAAFCFSNQVNRIEYYHNSSWLEYGGAPEKAVRNAFVYAIDAYLKAAEQVYEERVQDHVPGRAGLPDPGDELLLHADVL